MPIEAFGWFVLGAGSALLFDVGLFSMIRLVKKRRKSKFEMFVEELKAHAPTELEKEVSELKFRDKNGVLSTVRIVIDPNLDDIIAANQSHMDELIREGHAGTLESLMAGHKVAEDINGTVQEFVFTPNAVRNMRAAGIEPDEVVTKMLKASGRMA